MKKSFLNWSLGVAVFYLLIYHMFLIEIRAPFKELYLFGNFLNVLLSGYIPSAGIVVVLDYYDRKDKVKFYGDMVRTHLEEIELNFDKSFEILPKNRDNDEKKKFCNNFYEPVFSYKEINGTVFNVKGYELWFETWGSIDSELELLLQNNPLGYDETRAYINDFRNNDFYKMYKEMERKVEIGGKDLKKLLKYDIYDLILPHDSKVDKEYIYIPIKMYEKFNVLKSSMKLLYKIN